LAELFIQTAKQSQSPSRW